MKTIWKFPLQSADQQTIKMPAGAELLSVQVQRETVCLWAKVDPEAAREPRVIAIFGTGHELPEDESTFRLEFIDTFQLHDGALVFHAFEVVRS